MYLLQDVSDLKLTEFRIVKVLKRMIFVCIKIHQTAFGLKSYSVTTKVVKGMISRKNYLKN